MQSEFINQIGFDVIAQMQTSLCFSGPNGDTSILSDDFTMVGDVILPDNVDVAIAMAVYDGDNLQWVEKAVKSIQDQTHQEFLFCIAIDGCISADMLNFLTETQARDSRLVLFQGKENRGLSSCMNFIINWLSPVSPSYFFRMDADDISTPNRIEIQKEYLDNNKQVTVLGSALTEINELGNVVGSRKVPLSHRSIIELLPKRCSINHPTVAMRYDVFNGGYRYREGKQITEDYFLWAELAADGYSFANLEDTLLLFRRVKGFYKRRGIHRAISEFKARTYTMKLLKKRTAVNYLYALTVLLLRVMPSRIVRLAYKVDRLLLDKLIKH